MGEANAGTALVLIDVLNPYQHDDAEQLAAGMEAALGGIARLRERARDAGTPVIYVNDNYGDWNSSAGELAERALAGARPDLVEPLLPDGDDMFVIKARHSIFYETPLEYLLRQAEIGRLVLCGQVTEQCVLYSALDAYVRHLAVAVPSDAVAHIHAELAEAALKMIERNMRGEITTSGECVLRNEEGRHR